MNSRFKIVLMFVLFNCFGLVYGQNNNKLPTTTAEFFNLIDLGRPDMVSVSALVNQGKYDAALEIWRDTVVNRLRKMDLGQFSYHGNLQYSSTINFAKMLVEIISPDTYYAGSISYYDYFDLTNSPYNTPKTINWLASVPSGMKDSDDGIANYTMFITLPATYYKVSDSDTISFYQHTNYTGNLAYLTEGNYTTAQLGSAGILNNDVSSVKVPSGYTVELYDGDNFTGSKYILTVNEPDLVAKGFNDKTSSVKIFKTIYLEKFMQVASDFALRQKNLIKALPAADQKLYNPNWSSTDAGQVLGQSTRVANAIRCLAVFAKNLPGEPKISDWNYVISTIRPKVINQNTKCISAKELSNIASSLVLDHTAELLAAYKNAGRVPNQRLNGLTSLMMISLVFPEFKAIPAVESETIAGITDYMNTMCAKDGGFLEQSFNYNIGDAQFMEQLVKLAASAGKLSMPWVQLVAKKPKDFNRMLWALKTPLMANPLVGNTPHSQAPNVWSSASISDSYKSTISATEDSLSKQVVNSFKGAAPEPSFTSVAFPYSGYYTQRQGWKIDDAYMFFMAGRSARGHKMADNNSIQVVAFGRELLSTDGQPDYAGTLPSEQQLYISEASSLKTNTIIVDGKSQDKNTGELQLQAEDPIKTRFYHSDAEDFMEGYFDNGYKDISASVASVTDVVHNRQVVFLKEAGIWIVSDLMNHNGVNSHTYNQIWNFTPYEPTKKLYGFKESDVMFDKTKRRIYTSDASGPNLLLQNFGKIPSLDYVKYYNQSSPAMGWFSTGYGYVIPAVDMHATWTGTGNQALGTIILPSEGLIQDLTFQDLSPDVSTVSLAFTLPNGNKLVYSSGFNSRQTSKFSFTFNSKGYLLQQSANGDVTGIVIGGDKAPLLWNGNFIQHGFSDYGINYSIANQTITLTPFEIPNTFVWESGPVASIQIPKQAPVVWQGSTTGINQNDGLINTVIYPNPTNSGFQIQSSEILKKINVYDPSGNLVYTTTDLKSSFGMSWLPGLYIVILENYNGTLFFKRVVKLNN